MIGHLRSLGLARTQAAQGALGCDLADLLGRFEFRQGARHRVPIIALHRAVFGLGDGNG